MADYQGNSGIDWERLARTTLQDHIRENEQEWLRSFSILALMEANGLISYNHSGRGFDWPVQYRRHNLTGNTGETSRNFVRVNRQQRAELPYRGYQAEDSISEGERMMNRGENAIVNLWDNFTDGLNESVRQGLAYEFFRDGNASGNEELWHGIESFMGWTQTITISSAGAVARTANDADIAAYPNDTYAGLSTVLGNYNGEGDASLSWPQGESDPQFDFWSPLILAYNSTATNFPATTDTFAGQGDEVLRLMIIELQRNAPMNMHPTTCLLSRELYAQFLNAIDGKEQIRVARGEPLELTRLGFKNVVEFDGVEVTWDTAVSSAVGYVMNYQNINLRCLYGTVFEPDGPHYDEHTQRYNAAVKHLGNLKFKSPRNFGKLVDSTP